MINLLKFCLIFSCLWISASGLARSTNPAVDTTANVDVDPFIRQRADPFITKGHDGTYYFMATVPEYDRLEIRKAKTIKGLQGAEAKVIWRKHAQGPMGNHIWAPELHHIDGVWYIYFAAGSAEDKWKIRKYVLANTNSDPTQGTWKEAGELQSKQNEFSLDATTFALGKKRFMVWVDRASTHEVNTGLYIAEMDSPTRLAEKQVVISLPEYDWEKKGHNVNEGPAVLLRHGKVFLVYSASATDATYCMGLLWADQQSDLLDPASWHKLEKPVFFTNAAWKRFGPGHNSFTVAEDGKTDIMVYHARDYEAIVGEPLYDPNRHTRIRVLKWREDGMPDFGQEASDRAFSDGKL
ncbi:family 43 glycosylhydrolase [Sphingobacterium oryzagri]|uniref:Family 43 glycosylhydrolase n=1 Tax=Sphingobacterium oryzagri TaxID=3025669 RepID=A0ABY7WHI8_9SPHI|nr:family 43 glycosylhydrolase [Sphingobacterium sp. KACC 22765]WDF69017.1 family 43 glycosylhydrolase [Sphingobacterium sp. KACC 22765]